MDILISIWRYLFEGGIWQDSLAWILPLLPPPNSDIAALFNNNYSMIMTLTGFIALSAYFVNVHLLFVCVMWIFFAIELPLMIFRLWIWLLKLIPFM